MTKAETESIVDQVMDAIPAEIAEALADVRVFVVDGRGDPELREAIRYAELERASVRRDFRGLYLGTTARALDAGDELPQLPEGSIVINCQAVGSVEDVRDTLGHEMGHALGLSEEEVENLGLG
jgi:predicted Zn-dependent protease with MMP-like domain